MKILQTSKHLALLFGSGICILGCGPQDEKGQGVPVKPETKDQKDIDSTTFTKKITGKIAEFEDSVIEAKATLSPTKGNEARGEVFFIVLPEGIRIVADFEGLTPGEHGFHIHDKGDCSAADASSAGGHFNPANTKHGGPQSEERHAGDLGNVTADQQGRAHYEWTSTMLNLGGEHSIIGRSVILHADPDDFVSQPVGNSGARVACGVIEAVK